MPTSASRSCRRSWSARDHRDPAAPAQECARGRVGLPARAARLAHALRDDPWRVPRQQCRRERQLCAARSCAKSGMLHDSAGEGAGLRIVARSCVRVILHPQSVTDAPLLPSRTAAAFIRAPVAQRLQLAVGDAANRYPDLSTTRDLGSHHSARYGDASAFVGGGHHRDRALSGARESDHDQPVRGGGPVSTTACARAASIMQTLPACG